MTMPSREHQDVVHALRTHRDLLRRTARDLDEDAARRSSTVSTLTIASLLKHVADTESGWIAFARTGSMPGTDDWSGEDTRFVLTDADTLPALLERYADVEAETTAFVESADLDVEHPLPSAPWFEQGASWSVRRCLQHVLAETAQHAGHADIIRESIDGARTMG